MRDEPTDEEIELLLTGQGTGEVAAFLKAIQDAYDDIPAPAPAGALTEYVSPDLVSNVTATDSPDDATVISLEAAPSRRRAARLAALTGTAVGKALVGASVAAASVTGAHATGLVDVPVLPEVIIIVNDDEVASDTETEPTATSIGEAVESVENTEVLDADAPDPTTPVDSPATTLDSPAPAPDTSDDGDSADDGSQTKTTSIPISDAGSLTVRFTAEEILSIDARGAEGWSTTTALADDSGRVVFAGPDNASIDVELELTDNNLSVRIEDNRNGSTDTVEIDRPGDSDDETDGDDETDESDGDDETDESDSDDETDESDSDDETDETDGDDETDSDDETDETDETDESGGDDETDESETDEP